MTDARLARLGLVLPVPPVPRFAYVPVVVEGGFAHVSGQLPWKGEGLAAVGKVGAEVDVAEAEEAARCCALQALAVLRDALGSLDRVSRVVKLTGFVASDPRFHEQPRVIDAASRLMVDVFGDMGWHARSAIGVAVLPRDASVELEMVVAVRDV
jgi:enamine deaminase RidA (YjgF/YER057c/UK114 family)